ncbi:hypothetical protein [Salegentibacter sp. Hel_I_6]|uniref:hypothetical protein n=1 Tax=Salegentibacter sp. Hel_I_6 TaxID=1250278 RepID=UPI00055C68BE|nr:hypothetical protein [Salegentibacter sp. Hel_I_6]
MRKFITLLFIVTLLACSKDEINKDESSLEQVSVIKKSDGTILSFPSTDSFLKEYSKLTMLGSENDFKKWIDEKGHGSLLNKSDSIYRVSDSIGVTYSNPIMAIFNEEGEVIIDDKRIWLNGNSLFVLPKDEIKENSTFKLDLDSSKMKLFGTVNNLSHNQKYNLQDLESSAKNKIENANRWRTFVENYESRRLITELYNETITFSDGNVSSKMYLRLRMNYESCSFWRCTWKNALYRRKITLNLDIDNIHWNRYNSSVVNTIFYAEGTYNFFLANYQHVNPYQIDSNFRISGTIMTEVLNDTAGPYTWIHNDISWYAGE